MSVREAEPRPKARGAPRRGCVLGGLLLCALLPGVQAEPSPALEALLAEVEADIAALAPETGVERLSEAVRAAFLRVPREAFVPPGQRPHAYENRPLPIGHGQTISQPFIVALMSELAELGPGERVLEVGTGSGYQAALLAELGAEVYSIEILEPLGRRAETTLRELGYRDIRLRIGDGYAGWPEAAPFDAIVVTAGPDHLPAPLVDQLAPGGVMVIPLKLGFQDEQLTVLRRDAEGRVSERRILPVRFVPLLRERSPP